MKKFALYITFILYAGSTMAQQAGFTFNQPSKCAPSTVTFTNTSGGVPDSYLWDFGDGSTPATTPNPQHPYSLAGTYTVTLTVYYGGTPSTRTAVITVLPPPVFSFTKLNDSVCPGGSVSFSSTVTYPSSPNAIRSYSWDFGDGGSSSLANPTHQYMNVPNVPVFYPVTLTVTDTNGCSSKETSPINYIYVKPKPIVDFAVDKQYFCVPDTPANVTFTDLTTATTNNTYLWQFSDGKQSTLQNPPHTFHGIGNFSVNLTVTSSEGCSNSLSKQYMVEVIDFKVEWEISDTILCSVPADVRFRGLRSTNYEYFWNFGDGNTGESSFYPITNTYQTAGTYLVTVMAEYRKICTARDSARIHVYDEDSLKGFFSINGSEFLFDTVLCDFQYNDPMVFENRTRYPVSDDFGFASTSWWFGDGDSATGNPISHIFSRDTNRYTITMRAITPYGCPLETTRGIWFNSYVPVNLAVSRGGCAPYDAEAYIIQECFDSKGVIFIYDWGDGSSPDTIWDWKNWNSWNPLTNWGNWSYLDTIYDGRPDMRCCGYCPPPCACSSSEHGYHTYTDTGRFGLTITYINLAGCPYIVTDTIPVGYPPKSWFVPTFKEDCYSTSGTSFVFVQAYDSLNTQGNIIARSRANEWFWNDFEQLCPWTSYEDTVWLQACDTGYLNVCLIAYHNRCPSEDTICMDSISYVCPPIAAFSIEPFHFCGYPTHIQPDNISAAATGYKWFFGDVENMALQSTSTAKNPSFTYPQSTPFLFKNGVNPGIMVTLIAYNDDSLDVNSPTYNRCKYCEDTAKKAIYIADGISHFINDPKDVCQGNEVRFYDTGFYNAGIKYWSLHLYPENPLNKEHSDTIYRTILKYGKLEPIYVWDTNYIDIQKEGFPLIFNVMDNYTAVLKMVDFFDCIYYDTLRFSIYPQSVPSFVSGKDNIHFTKGKDTLCANYPDVLYLQDSSFTHSPFDTAEITDWKWKIIYQDSLVRDSSTMQNPTFNNLPQGMYDLNMHIVNQYGCTTDSVFKTQILVNQITTAFYSGLTPPCNHELVEFYNLSYIAPSTYNKNTVLTCIWDFGDGTPPDTVIGTTDRMYHTYHLSALPQTVTVSLTVWANGSCYQTYTEQITITGPIASFTDNGHQFPCPEKGRKVHFQSTSTGNIVEYRWNFGDTLSGTANESNLKDPIHDYLRAGYYDVSLVVVDNNGCKDTLPEPKYVFIDGPIGEFTYGELSGCVEHTVTFTPSNIYADSIIVNPDKANPVTADGTDVHNPLSYTFKSVGAYPPYFYLIKWIDNNGTWERCVVEWEGKDTIFVIDIIPDFETDSIYCPQGEEVIFPNRSELIPNIFELDSAIWTFGNGDSLQAIDGRTKYSTSGTYTVSMTVYAQNCSKQISKNIEVLDLPQTIYTDPDSANICGNELMVDFTAAFADDLPPSLSPQQEWIFDDGEIIYGTPASRNFYKSGIYPYKLLITFGQSNCVHTYFDTIRVQVRAFPTAEFEANPQTVNFGEEIQFIDKSIPGDGKLTYWYWIFSDSTDSYQQNPAHSYTTTSGEIPVFLWIEDEFGCRDSIEHKVLVLENLEFPNIFSPIGSDGKRYYFRPIKEKGFFKDFQLIIYDRWGMRVWENSCTNPNCPDYGDSFWWDGNNKLGKRVEDGVYFWVVEANPLSGTTVFVKNGSVTVVGKK